MGRIVLSSLGIFAIFAPLLNGCSNHPVGGSDYYFNVENQIARIRYHESIAAIAQASTEDIHMNMHDDRMNSSEFAMAYDTCPSWSGQNGRINVLAVVIWKSESSGTKDDAWRIVQDAFKKSGIQSPPLASAEQLGNRVVMTAVIDIKDP